MNPLLETDRRLVIGHRGASADAPENTLPAFKLALEQGAGALELDVRVTADGVPVVIHDATLERTTDLTGPVSSRTASELAAADAGAKFTRDGGRTFPWRGRGVRVPLLIQVLSETGGVPLIVEVKDSRAQAAVRRILIEHEAAEQCVLAAEDYQSLAAFAEPPFLHGASRRDITRLFIRSRLGLGAGTINYRMLAVPASFRGLTVPTRRFVRLASRAGCPVHVWTVNEVELARRMWDYGACGIITDQPGEMAAELGPLHAK